MATGCFPKSPLQHLPTRVIATSYARVSAEIRFFVAEAGVSDSFGEPRSLRENPLTRANLSGFCFVERQGQGGDFRCFSARFLKS